MRVGLPFFSFHTGDLLPPQVSLSERREGDTWPCPALADLDETRGGCSPRLIEDRPSPGACWEEVRLPTVDGTHLDGSRPGPGTVH